MRRLIFAVLLMQTALSTQRADGENAALQTESTVQTEPSSQTDASSGLKVGIAEVVITPPQGFPMSGYYHERLATGTRDPLKAKAIVFRDGDRQAAFVVADLTGVSRDLCVEVRKRAELRTGILAAHISVCATHSHTGPDYTRSVYEYLDQQKTGDSSGSTYPSQLIDGLVESIAQASASTEPARIEAGHVSQMIPVSFNRRFVMKDGSVQTWQSLKNPEVVRAAGPIDPEISLIRILSADGSKTRGVVSSFALHLDTVGGLLWSADYPYYIEQSLRKALGDQVVSLFGAGTCGDINHVDPTRSGRNSTEFIGSSLANTIQTALVDLKPVASQRLQVRSSTVELPLQEVVETDLMRAEQLLPAAKAGQAVDFFDQVSAYKSVMLDQLRNNPPMGKSIDHINWGLSHTWKGTGSKLPVDVMSVTIGHDVAIVFLPGEVFVELGLAIKRGSPYPTTLVVELSNCIETLYIPTRAAYAGGSYEVTNSALEPGGGEMLVEAALSQLRASASAK